MPLFYPFNLTRDRTMNDNLHALVYHRDYKNAGEFSNLRWLFLTDPASLFRLIHDTGASVKVPSWIFADEVEATILTGDANRENLIESWRNQLLESGEDFLKTVKSEPLRYWTLSHADVPNWHPCVNGSERDVDLVLEHAPGWWKDPAPTKPQDAVWRWLTGADKEHIARELEAAVDKARLAEPRWWDMEHDVAGDGPVMLATMDQACAVTGKASGWTAVPSFSREARRLDSYLDATQPDGVGDVAADLNALVVPAKPQPRRITLRGALNVANLVKNSVGLRVDHAVVKVMGHEIVNFGGDHNGYALPDQVITLDADGHAVVEVYTGLFVTGTIPRTFTFLNVTPI
jgi:hypothetical protein